MRKHTLSVVLALAVLLAPVAYYIHEIRQARAETAELVSQAYEQHGRLLSLHDLTPERLRILLAVEDPRFFTHRGVDLTTPGAGMTTISQGLVKLLYFPGGFHQGVAKIRQTLIAQYAFDDLVSKDAQLELLLNIAYFGSPGGSPVRGFSQAARVHLGKEFSALSDGEFKLLVAMLIAPDLYTPGSPALGERVARIEAYVSGQYHPLCVLDTEYDGKTRGSWSEELLMALLRLITDADPHQAHAGSAVSRIDDLGIARTP